MISSLSTDHKLRAGTNTKKALSAVYVTPSGQFIFLDPLPSLSPTFMVLVSPAGLHNMGGDPVSVIHDIRDLLDIGRNRKKPREDYLGEFYCLGLSTPLS